MRWAALVLAGLVADGETSVTGIEQVLDVGRSANGQAVQLLALAANNSGNQNYQENLIDGMRAKIASAGLPAGLRAHLAGSIAVQVDQQKASGNTGNKVQDLSLVFIILLLVLIFRSLTLAITTVLPALLSVLISGPLVAEAAKHGLQVSPLAQFLLIVLVLGAGTDYGLFLVFRVREELRAAGHDVTGMDGAPEHGLFRSLLSDLTGARPAAWTALSAAYWSDPKFQRRYPETAQGTKEFLRWAIASGDMVTTQTVIADEWLAPVSVAFGKRSWRFRTSWSASSPSNIAATPFLLEATSIAPNEVCPTANLMSSLAPPERYCVGVMPSMPVDFS